MQGVVVVVQQCPVTVITAWANALVTPVPDGKEGKAAVDVAVVVRPEPWLVAGVTMTEHGQPVFKAVDSHGHGSDRVVSFGG